MNVSDFEYVLPSEHIAQEPLADRDASRLQTLDRATGKITHRLFRDLPDLLCPGDLLVMNRSKVFPARLLGKRSGGGRAEVLLVRPRGANEWEALVRPGRRLRQGSIITIGDDLHVRILSGSSLENGCRRVQVETRDELRNALERLGHTPLPPYIRRPDHAMDRERYQTVFAREEGSVAAPTAGMHFSRALLAALESRSIQCAEIVLHVGPGTFLPVKCRELSRHHVMPEAFVLPPETADAIAAARKRGSRVIAVGTTTTRVLESASSEDGKVVPTRGDTGLTIIPGFRFRVVDALITNFHLPRSSLLLLVCAFAGRERTLDAYREAIRLGYRFYSYGDAMFIV